MIPDERLKYLIEYTGKLMHINLGKRFAILHPYEEYYELLKELLTLRQQNAELIAKQKETKIHIDDMVKISGEMAQENAEWKQDAERLADVLKCLFDGFIRFGINSEGLEAMMKFPLDQHQALMEKYK